MLNDDDCILRGYYMSGYITLLYPELHTHVGRPYHNHDIVTTIVMNVVCTIVVNCGLPLKRLIPFLPSTVVHP